MSSLKYKYSNDAREIIKSVHAFCTKEKRTGMKTSLVQPLDRAAELTGVSKSTIKRIVKSESLPPMTTPTEDVNNAIDDFDKGVVRRTISTMYTHQKILPTLKNIRRKLTEDIGYKGNKNQLWKLLMNLGFSYKRCDQNRKVLMERQDVVLHRIRYLRKIEKLRKTGHPIVYTDETYVHTNHSVTKCWQDSSIGLKIPFSKGERMIILHDGYEQGFIPVAELIFKAQSTSGDYHSEMNQQNFTKWLTEKLIPNLPERSVVVLDNAAYHNVQVDRCPTTSTRKADIQAWLTRHNIHFTEKMYKPDLLQLCKKHRPDPVYVGDDLLARHGHQALRLPATFSFLSCWATCGFPILSLPPYHADLNPIELIWGNLKGFIARKNLSFNLEKVKELINEGLQTIGGLEWQKCVEHVITIEKTYRAIDIAAEYDPDPVVICLSDSENEIDTDSECELNSETDTASECEMN